MRPSYYPIAALTIRDTPVRFLLAGGEVTGAVKSGPDGVSYRVLRDDRTWHELPDFATPSLWRPLDGQVWPHDLPEPAALSDPAGRLWSSTTRFAAVDDAEADDLAREMEADRADARAHAHSDQNTPHTRLRSVGQAQWWRDPFRVTYSAPGRISKREVEGRVSRAVLTDGLRPYANATMPFAGTSNALAALAAEILSSQHDDPARWAFDPTPADHGDYLTAMGWFAALGAPHYRKGRLQPAAGLTVQQRVFVWRALPLPASWRQIADDIGRSHEYARQQWQRACERLCEIANGDGSTRL